MTSLLVAIGVETGGAKAPLPTYVKGGLAPQLCRFYILKNCTDKISLEEMTEEFVT